MAKGYRQEQRQTCHTRRKHTTHTSGTTKPSQPTVSRHCPLTLIDRLNTERVTVETIDSLENLYRAGQGTVKVLDIIRSVFNSLLVYSLFVAKQMNILGTKAPNVVLWPSGRLLKQRRRKRGSKGGREGGRDPRVTVAQLGWSIATGLASLFLGTNHGAQRQSCAC